ncbi:MAG: LapA family protein, partial [Gammaproteobacteria bacterium]|nr:LapA family protein [Gammaproteobacteria bacterium]
MRNVALAILLLVVVTVAVILGLDNQTPISVHFLDRASPEWPAFWWLCAAFGAGLLLGVTLCAASLVRSRFNQRLLRRSLQQREPSAGSARGLPLARKSPQPGSGGGGGPP